MEKLVTPVLSAAVLASGAGLYLQRQGIRLSLGTGTALGVLFLYLGFYFALLRAPLQQALWSSMGTNRKSVLVVPLFYVLSYLLYAFASDGINPQDLGVVMLFTGIPTVLLWLSPREQRLSIWDILAILAIWIPIDMGLFQAAWDWPQGSGRNVFAIPFAVGLTVTLFGCLRGLKGMKFSAAWQRGDWEVFTRNLLFFLVIAIPLGLWTGFIALSEPKALPQWALSFLATFLLVAVPEELLFRSIIQNCLQKTWRNQTAALWTASVIFGLSHLNNGSHPDWRYAVLATIAGYFYGKSYNSGSSFLPAVLVHTSVDVLWVNLFR